MPDIIKAEVTSNLDELQRLLSEADKLAGDLRLKIDEIKAFELKVGEEVYFPIMEIIKEMKS